MMPDDRLYGFSESDIAFLKRFIREQKDRPGNTTQRAALPEIDSVYVEHNASPDLYVALTPSSGIPGGEFSLSGTGSPHPPYFTEGRECQLYKIEDDGEVTRVGGLTRLVYNIATDPVPGTTFVTVKKTKHGKWVADLPSTVQITPGSGTGAIVFDCHFQSVDGVITLDLGSLAGEGLGVEVLECPRLVVFTGCGLRINEDDLSVEVALDDIAGNPENTSLVTIGSACPVLAVDLETVEIRTERLMTDSIQFLAGRKYLVLLNTFTEYTNHYNLAGLHINRVEGETIVGIPSVVNLCAMDCITGTGTGTGSCDVCEDESTVAIVEGPQGSIEVDLEITGPYDELPSQWMWVGYGIDRGVTGTASGSEDDNVSVQLTIFCDEGTWYAFGTYTLGPARDPIVRFVFNIELEVEGNDAFGTYNIPESQGGGVIEVAVELPCNGTGTGTGTGTGDGDTIDTECCPDDLLPDQFLLRILNVTGSCNPAAIGEEVILTFGGIATWDGSNGSLLNGIELICNGAPGDWTLNGFAGQGDMSNFNCNPGPGQPFWSGTFQTAGVFGCSMGDEITLEIVRVGD